MEKKNEPKEANPAESDESAENVMSQPYKTEGLVPWERPDRIVTEDDGDYG